jgi:hypothetical protein
MTFEDEEILEIPFTIDLETVNIFQDDEAQVVIQQCYILPVDRHGSQTWCLILNYEKLQLFTKKIGKISRPNMDEVRGYFWILTN